MTKTWDDLIKDAEGKYGKESSLAKFWKETKEKAMGVRVTPMFPLVEILHEINRHFFPKNIISGKQNSLNLLGKLSATPVKSGGSDGTRTRDLLRDRQAF